MKVSVIGAGLAGCEAAWQLAKRKINVTLYEMKPVKYSKAHTNENFCELVCSNSLKAERIHSAAGLLKEEMRLLDSLLIECAYKTRVPAGGALAVDRKEFSRLVTKKIKENRYIKIESKEIKEIPKDGIIIIATGPLTSEDLSENIQKVFKGSLNFFDAAAPIVTKESIDLNKVFYASRYDKGEDDAYLNCPMSKEEYERFYNELINAERAPVHSFDVRDPKIYEGCMPVEVMAGRGIDTLRFGPLKPVGLTNPKTGKRPYAVVQLRQENSASTMYNMVGFQTNLKFPEQKRVFSMIPGLENADFIRYGVMHRNTYIDSPRILDSNLSVKKNIIETGNHIFFAGQITGVEGYMESASTGIIAAINAINEIEGKDSLVLPNTTMIGALIKYITDETVTNFQPMGANFGIIRGLDTHIKNKKDRYEAFAKRSIEVYNMGLSGGNI